MGKAILAIIGFNIIVEHPYIALAVACVIAYGIYYHFQHKQEEQNNSLSQEANVNTSAMQAISIGVHLGALKDTHQNFVKDVLETIKGISGKVYKKIYLENKAIENKPANLPEVFDEIRDDVNNYFFRGTQKLISTYLKKKYPVLTTATHEGITKLFDNDIIHVDMLKNILNDYYRICDRFLKTDLIKYVGETYDVWLSFDLNGKVVYNDELSDEEDLQIMNFLANGAVYENFFYNVPARINELREKICQSKDIDLNSPESKKIFDEIVEYFALESQNKFSQIFRNKYPTEMIYTHDDIKNLVDNKNADFVLVSEILREYIKICEQTLNEDVPKYVKEKFLCH